MIKINRNSWHVKMIETFTSYGICDIEDSCQYVQKFLFAGFLAIFTYATIFFMLFQSCAILIHSIIGTYSAFVHGWNFLTEFEKISIYFVGTVISLFSWGVIGYNKHVQNSGFDYVPKEPSTLTKLYRSWKEKYCEKVEFE